MAERLLTAQWMESVWPMLLRTSVTPDAIARLPDDQRMGHWDLADRGSSLQEQACFALFAFAVTEFSLARPTGTQREADARAAPYFAAADMCRAIVHQAPFPSPDEKKALELSASYIENWTDWQLNHLKNSPYTVGERSNQNRGFDNNTRARVRALAMATHAIFNKPMRRVVATITMVALGTDKEITPRSVINWCSEGVPIRRPAR
jgi:hypothetical protein